MSTDPNKVNVELIKRVSNDPNSSGRDEVLTAEAISKKAGRLQWEYITDDVVATPNHRYISAGQHTVTLPDPQGINVKVGDAVALDQIQDVGAIVAHDAEFEEIFDASNSQIRVMFEVGLQADGTTREWVQIVTGTGNTDSQGSSIIFSGSGAAGVTNSRVFEPIGRYLTELDFSDQLQKTGTLDLAALMGTAIPRNATHVQLRVMLNVDAEMSTSDSSFTLDMFFGQGNKNEATVAASNDNKLTTLNIEKASGTTTKGKGIEHASMTVKINRTGTDNVRWVLTAPENVFGTITLLERNVEIYVDGFWINEARNSGIVGDPVNLTGTTFVPLPRTVATNVIADWNDTQSFVLLTSRYSPEQLPDNISHVLVQFNIDTNKNSHQFDKPKDLHADALDGGIVVPTNNNKVMDFNIGADGKYKGSLYTTVVVPYEPGNGSINFRVISDGVEIESGPTGIQVAILGVYVDESSLNLNSLEPLVGKILDGVSQGGTNWSFPGLIEKPRTDTVVFVNGQLQDTDDVAWSGLFLSIVGSSPLDNVKLMTFVDPSPLGEAEISTNGGNHVNRTFVDYDGTFTGLTGGDGTFSFTDISEEPEEAYNLFIDGLRCKTSRLTWNVSGDVIIDGTDGSEEVVLSILKVLVTPA